MSLALDIKKIEGSCPVDGRLQGSFILSAKNTERIAFMIRTSHRRIRLSLLDHNGRIGEEGIGIDYEIVTKGLDAGTVFKGSIYIVSDAGEIRIPVILSVVKEDLESSQGSIRNLFHFTNLAKADFNEAVELFYKDGIGRIFEDGERDIYFKYRAFRGQDRDEKSRALGVEEFLVESNKKMPMILSFAESSVVLRNIKEDREMTLAIKKSGWGYPGFEASKDGDFIELCQSEYGAEDFEGNFAEIRYRILSDKLHMGHNFGSITIKALHTNMSIPVFVEGRSVDRMKLDAVYTKKMMTVKLMKEFIGFRIGDTSAGEWIERSNRYLERLLAIDRNDTESRLMQAQLLLASKRYDEAEIVLNAVGRQMGDANDTDHDILSYYLYLRAMCDQDSKELAKTVRKVWDIYDRDRSSWRVLWILIYLDESIKRSHEREKALLEEQIMAGVTSPLMYLEAYSIFSHEPYLINKLSDFEINVLNFAIKYGLLKKEIAESVALLTQRLRGFDVRVMNIMAAYFKEFKDDEMLRSICSYLIRNDITDRKYHGFFKEAVTRDLGVTNLYDFYLYTMDQNTSRLLPKNVLMYYSFKNDLPPDLKAYVYANMIVNKDECQGFLSQSMDACSTFALNEILNDRMDENLAIIIDHLKFLKGEKRPGFDSKMLDRAIISNGFKRLVTVDDPKIRSLIVIEEAFREERVVPVKAGRAYVNVYDNDYELFFEDEDGKRYGKQYVTYQDIRLLRINDFLNTIEYPRLDEPGLWVALAEKGRNTISVDDRNHEYVRRITESDLFSEIFKEGLLISLLRYYYDNNMTDEIDSVLSSVDVKDLSMDERNEYIRFCSIKGDDDEAYEVIRTYGSYGMDPKILMRISTHFIEEGREVDPVLLEIAEGSFRGNKYNELILDFMSRYFEGTVRDLKSIWRACKNFDCDPTVIEGRIIDQMLSTGAYIGERDEIFFDYIGRNASKKIVSQYFRESAKEAFLKDTVLDDRFFMGLLDFAMDEEISDVEALCLIRFFSDKRDLRSDRILYPYIRELAERDVVFDFFLRYRDLIPSLDLFSHDVFIDYRTEAAKRVTFNYCLDYDEGNSVSYKSQPMRELYPGIYQTRFDVFPGETIQYYITEENIRDEEDEEEPQDSERGLTRSGVERSADELNGGNGRYDILQDAILTYNMKDTDSFMELAEDYIRKDRIVREIIWEESSDAT